MKSLFYLLFCSLISFQFGFSQSQLGPGYKTIILDSTYQHTKWGVEPSDMIYKFAAYTTSFDSNDDNDGDGVGESWGIPEWVAYEVKKKTGQGAPSYNRPKWMTDTAMYSAGIVPKDETYHVLGTNSLKEVKNDYRYVRGHMCPKEAADRMGLNAGWNTHTVLNAVPQLQWQNNGIWKKLENKVTEWADELGSVWVVCGPVFFNKTPAVWLGQKDEVRAAVPDALYKIIIRESTNSSTGVETLAFLIPNVLPKEEDELPKFLTSTRRLQELTGLTFLTELPEAARNIELNRNSNLHDREAIFNAWN
jgi:DNA/RNA endonuclease G (NUC1)